MTTATLLKNDEYQFADEMESYVKKMKEDRNINGTEKHRAETSVPGTIKFILTIYKININCIIHTGNMIIDMILLSYGRLES